MLILILSGHCKYYRSNNHNEGLVAPADYGSPLCEWLVGWASQPIFFFSFLLLSFRTGDGIGYVRFCSWDVPELGPALGSNGLGGGLGGEFGGLGGGRGGKLGGGRGGRLGGGL